MSIRQSYNSFPRRRLAAIYSRKDRVLYSTTLPHGGRSARVIPTGMTMVEVLVAMTILLIGIWALATGFPKLLGVLSVEEKRTEMVNLLESTVEQHKRNAHNLPLAIRGDSTLAAPEGIHANSKPDDPDSGDFGITPANSRDDIVEIIGESFVVPAPGPTAPYPVHIFQQGLADPPFDVDDNAVTQVYQIVLSHSLNLQVTEDGLVTFDNADLAEISYAWWDDIDLRTHYVDGEVIAPNGYVDASNVDITGHHRFHRVVEGSVHGVGRQYFTVIEDDPVTPVNPLALGEVVQDITGAVLRFHPNAVGLQMRVNYTLRLEPQRYDRRALLMTEEHRIISAPQTIQLISSHIDDELALPLDLGGDETSVFAVDINTGETYWEGYDIAEFEDDEAAHGIVHIDASGAIGHDLRFYYATTDQDLVTLQKAPAVFVDRIVVAAASVGDLLYRSYLRDDRIDGSDITDLWFEPCNAGHTVAVDYTYLYGPDAEKRTVRGEMHTINTEPYDITVASIDYDDVHGITLDYDNVQEIIAVRGMSLKARAWWRTPNGRLVTLDVDTVLALTPIY